MADIDFIQSEDITIAPYFLLSGTSQVVVQSSTLGDVASFTCKPFSFSFSFSFSLPFLFIGFFDRGKENLKETERNIIFMDIAATFVRTSDSSSISFIETVISHSRQSLGAAIQISDSSEVFLVSSFFSQRFVDLPSFHHLFSSFFNC